MNNILEEVRQERQKQNEKWGVQNHNLPEFMTILMEEVGEASQHAVDFHHRNKATGDGLSVTLIQSNQLTKFRREMIQVAAVAVQIIERIDRGDIPDITRSTYDLLEELSG